MERKIRVGAVSYLNTKPLVYGLESGNFASEIDLRYDYPARLADLLKNDEIDIGLVPTASIKEIESHEIVSKYCIGSQKEVASVCLFSHLPINKVTHILVDFQSRTSAILLKILLKEYWNLSPILVNTSSEFVHEINGSVAGLVIGDRAFLQRKISPYIYDLAMAWNDMTDLPFVFAAWVSNKKLSNDFIEKFDRATGYGLQHLPEIAASYNFEEYDLLKYYTKNICYELTNPMQKGMNLFMEKMGNIRSTIQTLT